MSASFKLSRWLTAAWIAIVSPAWCCCNPQGHQIDEPAILLAAAPQAEDGCSSCAAGDRHAPSSSFPDEPIAPCACDHPLLVDAAPTNITTSVLPTSQAHFLFVRPAVSVQTLLLPLFSTLGSQGDSIHLLDTLPSLYHLHSLLLV